jgi:hypothetical protein
LPRTEHPFMGLLARSESLKQPISPLWLPRSRFAVNFVSALRSSQVVSDESTVKKIHLPLVEFRCPPRYYPNFASRSLSTAGTFHGLQSPLTHEAGKIRFTRVSTPATFHPQGLVTLSMVCSLAGPVDFVSRRQRLWGLTLRSFLLPDGYMTFLPCSPRVSLPRIRARRSKPTRANPEPDYQVLPPGSPLRREKCLALRAAGDSLGLHPFQGDSKCRLEQVLPPVSSHALISGN